MLPSHTVENYLKAIFQAQTVLSRDELVPMGQLAESGLVRYEPYSGVRLTKAGEKLAALVLRRHRLIELFLVKVMGMSWTDVHDEAEHLEHAVSDRLIDRIDEMLGRPSVDPHGDPIPDRHGMVEELDHPSLATCEVGRELRVVRVLDQDPEFLRSMEDRGLTPGRAVRVEERARTADTVALVVDGGSFSLGLRAAAKVFVEAAE
jgi:DtxR family Mn-dependent transcriptional regulator